MLLVATDGGCHPNPGPGGWAWVDEHGRYEAGSFTRGTNNIAELQAVRHALLVHQDVDLTIQYDSQYAVGCVTTWGPSWRRKGTTGKANQDLVYEIMDILDARDHLTLWQWVKGHDTTNAYPLNTAVDTLATRMTRLRRDGHVETGTITIDWSAKPTPKTRKKKR